MPLCSPPMMPASPSGFAWSATSSSDRDPASSIWPLSSVSFSPARAKRTTRSPSSMRIVVGVQRLAQLEHHVVGDVDDRRDRADAAALEALLHPRRRRGARVDAFDDAPAEARARQRILDPRTPRRAGSSSRISARGGGVIGAAVIADDLARDAEHRQAIGAVGRELEREAACRRDRALRAGRCRPRNVRIEHQQARRIVGDAQLAAPSRACPAIRRRASPSCDDPAPPGQLGAHERARDHERRRRRWARRRRSTAARHWPGIDAADASADRHSGWRSTASTLATTTP